MGIPAASGGFLRHLVYWGRAICSRNDAHGAGTLQQGKDATKLKFSLSNGIALCDFLKIMENARI